MGDRDCRTRHQHVAGIAPSQRRPVHRGYYLALALAASLVAAGVAWLGDDVAPGKMSSCLAALSTVGLDARDRVAVVTLGAHTCCYTTVRDTACVPVEVEP